MSKPKRQHHHFLNDILFAIQKINQYTLNLDYDSFCQNPMAVDAVIRNFEIIGEAANKVPKDIQERFVRVEWKEIIGMRNILIHDYFEIDLEAVWDTIKQNIPELKKHIEDAVTEMGSNGQ